MLSNLNLYNFSNEFELPSYCESKDFFLLKTCQRTLVLSYEDDPFGHSQISDSYESHRGESAYSFLLETICGLKSKLLGENEIVSQFKTAYKVYIQNENRDTSLMRILEKLFKDSKEVRAQYLAGISQKTYASITRKILFQKNKATRVLIIGSGNLAEDLINQFKKKCPVYISARNTSRVQALAQQHGIGIIQWGDYETYTSFSHIANTIGANTILFDEYFFQQWKSNSDEAQSFVDLGSPSVVESQLNVEDGLYRLSNIFAEGAVHEKHKKSKIKMASEAIDTIVEKRSNHLKISRENQGNSIAHH